MKILKVSSNYTKQNISKLKPKISKSSLKNYTENIKSRINKIGQKTPVPIKYYLIGLILPIPFASTVGLILGSGIYACKKVKELFIK